MLVATEVTLFEFDAVRVPMKSLVDGIGTLTKGGLVVKTEVGEDIWDLDIITANQSSHALINIIIFKCLDAFPKKIHGNLIIL